jgi:hypothetical protein
MEVQLTSAQVPNQLFFNSACYPKPRGTGSLTHIRPGASAVVFMMIRKREINRFCLHAFSVKFLLCKLFDYYLDTCVYRYRWGLIT